MVLILTTATACFGNEQNNSIDLITKIRIFFNINEEEATDQELIWFLQDEGNKTFIVSTIKQIEFGKMVFEPRNQSKPIEGELIEYMGKRSTFMTLEFFLNQITNLPIATVVNNLLAIHRGYQVFEKLADALAEFNRRNIMYLYIHERDNGQDKTKAFNSTINDPIFESVVNEILMLTEPSLVGEAKPEREARLQELKQDFWHYCEYVYQSWDLANNREKKENIKKYILEWIEDNDSISSPGLSPTSTSKPRSSSTEISGMIDNGDILGTYVNQKDRREYIELKEDGNFLLQSNDILGSIQGELKRERGKIILSYSHLGLPGYAEARIEDNLISVIEDGRFLAEKWMKEDVLKIAGEATLTAGSHRMIKVLDHYLSELERDPRLRIDYQNISSEPIRVRIQIFWLDQNGLIITGAVQENNRGPISPGQGETLIYSPEFTENATSYYLEIHATGLSSFGAPPVAFPEVGPKEEHPR